MSRISNRLKRLEAHTAEQGSKAIVYRLIAENRFYDCLSEEERQLYADYKGIDRQALEQVNLLVCGNLHFELERNTAPPTAAEHNKTVAEIKTLVKSEMR